MTTQSEYMEIADKISKMVNEKLTKQNAQDPEPQPTEQQLTTPETVDDALKDLIHMDKKEETANQDGGVSIEEVMENLTGGNANVNGEVPLKVVEKNVDEDLFEGGGINNEFENEEEEDYDTLDNENEKVIDYYEEFLKHAHDTTITGGVMYGGDDLNGSGKIKIISRFPYMIRY